MRHLFLVVLFLLAPLASLHATHELSTVANYSNSASYSRPFVTMEKLVISDNAWNLSFG